MNLAKTMCVAAVLGLSLGQAAQAACTLADIKGTWKAYSSGTDSGVTYWRSCKVVIAANGNVSNPSCVDSIGTTTTMSQGKVSLQKGADCAYSAKFKFAGQNNTVDNMTLARDKLTVYGVGSFPTGSFIFSMVKI